MTEVSKAQILPFEPLQALTDSSGWHILAGTSEDVCLLTHFGSGHTRDLDNTRTRQLR